MPLPRGALIALVSSFVLNAQTESRKELTPRELFYAAAQAPASKPSPQRSGGTSRKATPKPAEIARAKAAPPPAPAQTPEPPSAPIVRTVVQTAPMPASGE